MDDKVAKVFVVIDLKLENTFKHSKISFNLNSWIIQILKKSFVLSEF